MFLMYCFFNLRIVILKEATKELSAAVVLSLRLDAWPGSCNWSCLCCFSLQSLSHRLEVWLLVGNGDEVKSVLGGPTNGKECLPSRD